MDEIDDPSKYLYNVRLIEKGSEDDLPPDFAARDGSSSSDDGHGGAGAGIILEVKADQIV